MGDFNAKIGVKDEDEENEWIGPFGIGTRNERGEKLIDFCTANRLFVTNSFFKKPRPRGYELDMGITWRRLQESN
ncbi:hypothetical protein RRG08_039119 [Elysia crispata]|uniref:Craniofacial development protein 2-like n=1 Tax=Elysia crispata TaxID=231223 RepID=A0AAE1DV99_9GAST|nr:hypothetical protein RRG08_039119 [Elysia crispata]